MITKRLALCKWFRRIWLCVKYVKAMEKKMNELFCSHFWHWLIAGVYDRNKFYLFCIKCIRCQFRFQHHKSLSFEFIGSFFSPWYNELNISFSLEILSALKINYHWLFEFCSPLIICYRFNCKQCLSLRWNRNLIRRVSHRFLLMWQKPQRTKMN